MGSKSNTSGKRVLPKKPGNHWSEGLLTAMKNKDCIMLEDELVVAIKDLYPKAKFHYLVCCKEDIATLKNIKVEHLDLLKHMQQVGELLAEKHKDNNFLIGYHSVPSMVRLHLHVISDDFDSVCLKTKKHWNSFTTEFFLPSEKVVKELQTSGKISHRPLNETKVLIDSPLNCHKCSYKPKHMPDLKHHIKTHIQSSCS